MRSGNIKIYSLSDNGNYKLEQKHDKIDFTCSNNEEVLSSAVSMEEKELNEKLYVSPFIYQINHYSENSNLTVEDFYLSYNKKYVKIGEIVRTQALTQHEKKRILKNGFEKWHRSNEKEIYKIFRDSRDTILSTKNKEFKKIKLKHYLFLTFSLVAMASLFLGIFSYIDFSNKFHRACGAVVLLISLVGFVLSMIQNNLGKKFKRLVKEHKLKHNKYNKLLFKKEFKVYKKIKKYYMKNYEENVFTAKPLLLNKLNITDEEIKFITDSSKNIKQQYANIVNSKSKFNVCYLLAVIFSYTSFIASVSYILLMLIYNAIQKY